MVDMAAQSTQNGFADARPRPPVCRNALRRAGDAYARLGGELPVREAGPDGDSRPAARASPLRRSRGPALDPAPPGPAAGPAAAPEARVEEAAPSRFHRRARQPGLLSVRAPAVPRSPP